MKTLNFTVIKAIWSLALCASILTANATTITSTSSGGRWDAGATWVGGVVPTSTDDVVIVSGANVIVRSPYTVANPALCKSLTINGTLTMGSGLDTGTKSLEVLSYLTINSGGVLTSDGVDQHRISVAGDFTNAGTFTYALNTGTIQLTFTGTADQIISGNVSQSFGAVVINKNSGKVSTAVDVTSFSSSTFTQTTGEFVAPENFSVTGAVVLTAGSFTTGANTTFGGNLTNNGASFLPATSTIIFNGTSQTVGGTTAFAFNNVTTSGTANVLVKNACVLNGNLVINDDTKFTVENALTVNGTTLVGNGTSGGLVVASATGTKTFVGLFAIMQGAIWDNAVGDNAHFHGGVVNNGTITPGTGTYYFEVNSQSISGTITFPKVNIFTGVVVTNNGNLTVSTSLSGAGSFIQGNNSTVSIGGTSDIITIDASALGNTVNYTGGAQTVRGIDYVNLGLSGTSVKTLRNTTINISGNFTLSGSVSATTATNIVIGGNVLIDDGSKLTIAFGFTVNGSTTIGNGSSGNLTITSASGTKIFTGLVTVAAGATWDNSVGDNAHFENGLINEGNFIAGTGTNYFELNSQSILGTVSIPRLHVGAGVTLTNNGNISIADNLGGGGTFVQGNNSTVNLGGTVIVTNFLTTGTNNTVNYDGGIQTIRVASYVNLGLSGTNASHVKTWPVGVTNIPGNLTVSGTTSTTTVSNLTVAGNLSIGANATLTNGSSFLLSITGTISGGGTIVQSNNSTLTIDGASSLGQINGVASNNVVNYNAASPQVIPGSYYNLMLNQSEGEAVLNGNVNVMGTLFLNTGNLDLEDYHLTIGSSASISISSPSETRMIVISGDGELRKTFTGLGSFTFPIGESTGTAEYSPVTVAVTSGSGFSSAYVGVRVVDAKHFSNNSDVNFLTRYWTVSQSGITNCEIDLSGIYSGTDVEGTENLIVAGQLTGTFNQLTNGWKKLSAITGNVFSATASALAADQITTFAGISNSNPTLGITGGNVTICRGTSVSLDAATTGEGSLIYSWSPSTGLSASDIANPEANPTTTTTYTLTIYDGNGASVSDNTSITVHGPITQVNNLIFCEGESGQLTASGADTYEWSLATGLSATTGTTVTANPTTTTVYTVKGTETSTSCFSTAQATVTVKPLPAKPTIAPSDLRTETPKLTSSSAAGNQWFRDGGIIGGATTQMITVTTDGSYTVQVTTNGCVGPVSDVYNIVIVGLTENDPAGSSMIYPNPALDVVHFDRSMFLSGIAIDVKVYDLMGRLQFSRVIDDAENSFDVRTLKNGPHIFMASQNNQIVIQKFIKN